MSFKENLLLLRGEMSRIQLARLLEISEGTVRNYEKGLSLPNLDVALRICRHFNVTPEWLLSGDGPMYKETASDLTPPPSAEPSSQPKDDEHIDVVWIRRLKARLSAGGGSFEVETESNGRFAFRSDWIHRKGNPKTMVLMEVSGDSMAPDICDKDMVLIDQSQNELVAGGIFAIGVEDTIMVKELDVEPGSLLIRSKNKDYETIRIPRGGDVEQSIRILGRVIWWCREVR